MTLDNTGAPWLQLSEDGQRLFINEGDTFGPDMVKSYEVRLTLEDDSRYGGERAQSFTFSFTLTAPENILPRFVDDRLVPEGENLLFIAGTAFRYRLPEIINADGDLEQITASLINTACPWLTLNLENSRIDVVRGTTDSGDVGTYPFEVILSDTNIYGVIT